MKRIEVTMKLTGVLKEPDAQDLYQSWQHSATMLNLSVKDTHVSYGEGLEKRLKFDFCRPVQLCITDMP